MHQRYLCAAAALLCCLPLAAHAEEAPDLCVDRPGLGTPTCTLEPGRVMVEFGALQWEHTAAPGARDDAITLADTLVRIGLGHSTDLQVGLGGWGHARSRSGNAVQTERGLGDAMIGMRHGFGSPDDAKVAVQAFVTLPIGRAPGGAGDWGAGVLVPIALPLPAGFQLELAPEVDAAVNGSGHGRHLAWGNVFGVSHPIGPSLGVTAEISAFRDEDPAGHTTDSRFALSGAWHAGRSLQIDFQVDIGLSADAPDHAILLGFARQF